MTNAELIQKIRAEIERKKGQTPYPCPDFLEEYNMGYLDAMDSILSFLSTLESEKPTQEELKREIEAQLSIFPYTKVSPELPESRWIVIRKELYMFARHFAKWGAEHAKEQSKPKVSDGLETEALRSAGVLLSEHFEDEDDDAIRTTALRCWKGGVIHGASWQKEQMLKEAVEGKVRNIILHENGDEVHYSITYPKGKSQYSINDKVKIIIL